METVPWNGKAESESSRVGHRHPQNPGNRNIIDYQVHYRQDKEGFGDCSCGAGAKLRQVEKIPRRLTVCRGPFSKIETIYLFQEVLLWGAVSGGAFDTAVPPGFAAGEFCLTAGFFCLATLFSLVTTGQVFQAAVCFWRGNTTGLTLFATGQIQLTTVGCICLWMSRGSHSQPDRQHCGSDHFR